MRYTAPVIFKNATTVRQRTHKVKETDWSIVGHTLAAVPIFFPYTACQNVSYAIVPSQTMVVDSGTGLKNMTKTFDSSAAVT